MDNVPRLIDINELSQRLSVPRARYTTGFICDAFRSSRPAGAYDLTRIWYADYYADGKRVQESTGTASRREAEKFLALRISEVQRGVSSSRSNYIV